MKKLHVAITTSDIDATVIDYSQRLGCTPAVVIPNEYALWRSELFNISVRQDNENSPGKLRHLGWEDPEAKEFSESMDVNGILWESFTALQQAEEIEEVWPGTSYKPTK